MGIRGIPVVAFAVMAGVSAVAGNEAIVITGGGSVTNGYARFSEALAALPTTSKADGRLVLLKDVSVAAGQTIPVGTGERVIDLNGKRVTVTGDANTYFLKPAKTFSKAIAVSNGVVDVQCGGFIDMPSSWGRLTLADLRISCPVEKSAYLINAHCYLTMTDCTVSNAYMGGVWVGETFESGGSARTAALTNCTFTLMNGTQSGGLEYMTACVAATDKSSVTLKECSCRAVSGDPRAFALYEATSGGYIYVEGDNGVYDGALKATKVFENGGGIYIKGGTFTNCAFLTAGSSQADVFYHLSGGVYDTDPGVDANRYVDFGHSASKLSDDPPRWTVRKNGNPSSTVTLEEKSTGVYEVKIADSSVRDITVSGLQATDTLEVPAQVLSVKGVTTVAQIVVKTSQGVDITSVVQVSVSGDVATVGDLIEKDVSGAYTTVAVQTDTGVETVRVKPEVMDVVADEEPVPAITEESVGVATIPGLTYQLMACDEPSFAGGGMIASDPVVATGTGMRIAVDPAKFTPSADRAFFRVIVTK